MRPNALSPLFAGIRTLGGVGPRLETAFTRLLRALDAEAGPRIIDLLFHLPTGLLDRSARPNVAEAQPNELATLDVTVTRHSPPPRGRRLPYRIFCEDSTGEIELIFFRGEKSYLERLLPLGERRLVSGRVDSYDGRLQMSHPDHVVGADDIESLPLIEPVYPLTAGITQKVIFKILGQALTKVPELTEWQDKAWIGSQRWSGFAEALAAAHTPQSAADLLPEAPARQRLAYDELLANQLALSLVRGRLRRVAGRAIIGNGALRQKIVKGLPFALTASQNRALGEIDADLKAPERMLRLLQGDVGSGKTIVALLAMASAVEAGHQAALMAPTEVLARQHHASFQSIAEVAGVRIALLTGRERGRERTRILDALAKGEIDMLIGTHALFSEDVEFRDLAFVVIDEQHRFGVHQRLALQAKGSGLGTDVLVMTATPIPRTLVLTTYGDMDVSQLREKPAGRQPVLTRAIPTGRLGEVIERLEKALGSGAQAYWVCPLVEESEVLDVSAAEARFADLQKRFGERVGLVHGKLSGSQKDDVMAAFAAGELSILVATTVIEVGVDVPNATIMIIEHSERFGLAQLHQLRGRVGRGSEQSACILLYKAPLGETARARIEILRDSDDGFLIAEEDLRLRGGGEVLGVRQSGLPTFRLASLPQHQGLLDAAHDDAQLILSNDRDLTSARGQALRVLLYLFARDEATRLLRAG